MDTLKKLLLFFPLLLTGCQMGYLFSSAYNQLKMLNSRIPIEDALKDPTLSASDKKKLELAQEARTFAEKELHLTPTQNYTTFVKLDRPYVTYVVSAAEKWQLKHFQWSYPFLGKMPYKGYFNEPDAKLEEENLKKENLDTYMRGVSAYSTLGWLKDPLLSSMLRYDDYDLVNTIIHETVHATLYIKHEADFNERLATFLGNKGAELFYLKKEGPTSSTLAQVKHDNEDDKIFSEFISKELKELDQWYKNLPASDRNEDLRMQRISEIQKRFLEIIRPKMKTSGHDRFAKAKLNNARLLVYKTYMNDLNDFEKLYKLSENNFSKFIEKCKSFESEQDPEAALKKFISSDSQASP